MKTRNLTLWYNIFLLSFQKSTLLYPQRKLQWQNFSESSAKICCIYKVILLVLIFVIKCCGQSGLLKMCCILYYVVIYKPNIKCSFCTYSWKTTICNTTPPYCFTTNKNFWRKKGAAIVFILCFFIFMKKIIKFVGAVL